MEMFTRVDKPAVEETAKQSVNEPVESVVETTDYRQAYADWAKSKGLDVQPDTLPEDFSESHLQDKVAEYYVDQKLQDPFMKELVKRGLTVDEYYEQLAPVQEMVQLPARDLYLNEKITQILNEEFNLKKLDGSDSEAIQTRVTNLQAELLKTIENVPEDVLEQAVAGVREKYRQQINELPDAIQRNREEQWKQERQEAIQQYEQQNDQLLKNIKTEIEKGNPYGMPFDSQAEKNEFLDYLKSNTAFTNIEIENNGKKTEVQDIPFLHKLVNDQDYMVKVLRIMYAIDNGGITEIKNQAKVQAVKGLGLEPVVKTSTKESSGDGRFAQTHKGY